MARHQFQPVAGYRREPRPLRARTIPLIVVVLALLHFVGWTSAGEIVVLVSGDAEPYMQAEAAARAVLSGQKHTVHTISLKEASEKGPKAAISEKADAVLAIGTPAALWAQKQAPAAVPSVYCMVCNPAGVGLEQRPSHYCVTIDVPLAAQFQLIEQALPKASAVGMLYRSDKPDSSHQVEAAKAALPAGWTLETVAVDKHGSVAAAIEELMRQRIQVIWTSPDSSVYDTATVRALLLAGLRAKTPVFGFSPAFVRAGALLGVGVDPRSQGSQAATLTLAVMRGAPVPAQPPAAVHPPQQFQIAVNTLVAEQLGVELPADLVQKAAHVFKAER